MSKKIFILSTPDTFGGGEVFLVMLSVLLSSDIHIVVVSPSLPQLKKGLLQAGAQFVELPSGGFLTLRYSFFQWLWRNRTMLRETQATIVLNGRGATYWAPIVRLLHLSEPVIIRHTEISSEKNDIKEKLYGFATQFSKCVVTVSETVATQHKQRWPGIGVKAIPNWVDGITENFSQSSEHKLLVRTQRVVVVGRLALGKGLDDVTIACVELPDLELHFFGDGPLRGLISKMGEKMPFIFMHGHVDNLTERLPDYVVLVSASYSESFSYAVAEGIQAGVLCVVSDIPAHRELLGVDYPEALFFPPGNIVKLRNALQVGLRMTLENDGSSARQVVSQARLRINTRNSPFSARKSYLKVLLTNNRFHD